MASIVHEISVEGFLREKKNCPIICIGIGNMFFEAMKELPLLSNIAMLLDNSKEKQRTGIVFAGKTWKVYPLLALRDAAIPQGAVILFTTIYWEEICENIKELTTLECYIYPHMRHGNLLVDRAFYWQKYLYCHKHLMKEEEAEALIAKEKSALQENFFLFPKVNVVITERCSLQCKHCRALVPLYKSPQHELLSEVKKELRVLLEAVDEVMDIEPIGGEPFLYPELAELLNFCTENKKIRNVSISTNGTIVPKNDVTEALRNEKVFVMLSDYGNLDKMSNFITYCERNSISFEVLHSQHWFDTGGVQYRERSREELVREYSGCGCNYYVRYLWNDRLWLCTRAPRLASLGVHESSHDFVELSENPSELRESLKASYRASYAEACNYCDQGNGNLSIVPAGVQIKESWKPSEYTFIKRSELERLQEQANCFSAGEP